ncbi:ATP-binding protein [Desulfovibrio cuneatus]|uniref:ATP-binding protein n=1 Tax=Desulfovibrio cuneatus TaxID=159728 RepID=UPI00146F9EC2|nr:ATP-binding protein [Desulfovibrio cuneatus]
MLLSEEDNFDVVINQVLGLLGEATNVDRVYIWSIHPSPNPSVNPELHTTQLYEWSVGAEPQQDSEICTNRPVSEAIPTWIPTFIAGHCVNNLVRNMPWEEQEQLSPQGIISILTAPIFFHGELWGFIGFDNCHSEHMWSEPEESILRAAGTLVGTAIHKRLVNQALLQSQQRFYNVAEATGEVLWTLDSQHRIAYISERVQSVLGYAPQELIGKDWRVLLANASQYTHNPFLQNASPVFKEISIQMLHKNGSLRWMRTSAKSVFDLAGNIIETNGTSLDITEVHEANDRLRQANEALEEANTNFAMAASKASTLALEAQQANKAKGDFIANMSHEIRTPMNAIMGIMHLVLRTELSEKQRNYLDKIDFASKALLHTINDILDFSKVDSGKLEMEHIPFSVEDIMVRAHDMVHASATEKNLHLTMNIATPTGICYLGDPLRLNQVLTNLLTNAIKFTDKGTITMEVSIKEECNGERTLHFSVQDSGIGISKEHMVTLFDAFYQADTTATRRYGGAGLGLTLCKNLVTLMGGDIRCESTLGQGSTFHFTARFPIVENSSGTTMGGLGELKILILSPDGAEGALLRELLHSFGCQQVVLATSLAVVQSLPISTGAGEFSLIFISDKLKGSLHTIAEQLVAGQPHVVPIIMALAREANPLEAEEPIHAVLHNPLSQSSLYESIIRAFGNMLHRSGRQEEDNRIHQLTQGLSGKRILLAEDNDLNQMVAEDLLTQYGLGLHIANNGAEAIRALEQQPFDLVLMDIQMPEMDGLTATKKIREQIRFASLPIVAMTAHAMQEDKQKSLHAGMNDHITKPINALELFTCLARWLK